MNDRSTVRIVVLILGFIAALLVFGEIKLVDRVIGQESPTEAAIALIAGISTLAGTAVGSLASMLVNTRAEPNQQEIENALAPLGTDGGGGGGLQVTGPGGGPVPVTETPAPHEDESGHFEGWWLALLLVAFLLGLICGRIGLFT